MEFIQELKVKKTLFFSHAWKDLLKQEYETHADISVLVQLDSFSVSVLHQAVSDLNFNFSSKTQVLNISKLDSLLQGWFWKGV